MVPLILTILSGMEQLNHSYPAQCFCYWHLDISDHMNLACPIDQQQGIRNAFLTSFIFPVFNDFLKKIL